MNTIKEKLASIKKILFDVPPVVPAQPAALDKEYKLKDGTAITVSDLSVGGTVMMNGQPIADGSYDLEDGTMMNCAGGVITDITAPAAANAPAEPATDFSAKFADIDAKFSNYEQKFAGYETRIAQAEATINNQKSINQQLFKIVEEMAAVPVAEPVEPKKNNFSLQSKESREDRIKTISANLKKIADAKNNE